MASRVGSTPMRLRPCSLTPAGAADPRRRPLQCARGVAGPAAGGRGMVLDVKFMDWAASHSLDTAKLKASKVRIFGKWYFPQIPPGEPMVNLRTGEVRIFSQPMLAGETLWAP